MGRMGINEGERDGAWEGCWLESLKTRDFGTNERLILKWLLKKWKVRVWDRIHLIQGRVQ
jgi:hypothetical protein